MLPLSSRRVWGVGPTYAETFYNQGCRSLDDLRSGRSLTQMNVTHMRIHIITHKYANAHNSNQPNPNKPTRKLFSRSKAQLTRQQLIGLKHFDDLSSRMSWSEADEIKRFVEKITLDIKPGLLVEGCGSYRYRRLPIIKC